jgi:hypothetical protein
MKATNEVHEEAQCFPIVLDLEWLRPGPPFRTITAGGIHNVVIVGSNVDKSGSQS